MGKILFKNGALVPKVFFGVFVLLFLASASVLAENPKSPLSGDKALLDPGSTSTPWGGCGPMDPNCYVKKESKVEKKNAPKADTVDALLSAWKNYVVEDTSEIPIEDRGSSTDSVGTSSSGVNIAEKILENSSNLGKTPEVKVVAQPQEKNPVKIIAEKSTQKTANPAAKSLAAQASGGVSREVLLSALRTLFKNGIPPDIAEQLRGPAGAQGSAGPRGEPGVTTSHQVISAPTNQARDGIGPINFIGGSVVPTNPSQNFGGETIFSATNLSAGKFITDSTTTASLTVTGTSSLGDTLASEDIRPEVDNTYALGSSTFRWSDLHLGPASLNIYSTTGTSGATSNYTLAELGFSSGNLNLTTTNNGSAVAGGINLTSAYPSGNTTTSAFNITTSTDLGAADELVQFGDSAATFLTVLGNGNLGLGDASPSATLTVGSGDLFQVAGATGSVTTAGDITATGDIAVNGGDFTTTGATFNLLNATATTLNIGGAATTISIGAATGTATINNATTAITGNATIAGTTGLTLSGAGADFTFSGSGDHDITASSGTLRIGANTVIGNILALDDTVDIGTAATRFDKFYANEVNASTIVGTLTGGNLTAETFSINSDNATADTEDGNLAFERGSSSPNALLTWDSTNDEFDFNSGLHLTGTITTDPYIILNSSVASDTDFWLGVQEDAGGDDDDTFQIGDGTTPGTNTFLTIDTSGNLTILAAGSFGGGYGSTGVTISTAGNISANGTLIVDSTSTLTGAATAGTGIIPDADDGAYLGAAGTAFSDLFLAEGAVINFDSSDFTITQANDVLTFAGGTLTFPTPFTLGVTSVTSTGTQLNYLNGATGTTGTITTNLVFSTSPTLVTPVLGAATYTTLSGGNITDSGLTSGRVTFASTGGLLVDDADFTFATDTLTVTKIAATTFTGNLTITKADPSIILDSLVATDTDFWLSVTEDAGGDDDDLFQIGDGTTPGTNPFLTIDTAGLVGIGTTTVGAKLDIDIADASSITAETITLRSAATAQTLTDGTTIASWRANQFIAPTLNGVAAGGTETVTTAATLYVDAAPSGSDITISNTYSIFSDAGLVRFDRDSIGTTATDGLQLMNNTDAAAGAQQYSPALRFRGEGWKTDATAASQNVDWRVYTVPVQAAANPTSYLSFDSSVNDGAFTNVLALTSAGNVGIGTTVPNSLLTVGVPETTTTGTTLFNVFNAGGAYQVIRDTTNNIELFVGADGGGLIGTATNHALSFYTNNSARGNISAAGVLIFANTSFTNSVVATSETVPLVIGGTAVGSSLALQSTSGVGTTDFIKFTVGDNGATEAMRIINTGNVGIGTTVPGSKLDVTTTALGVTQTTSSGLALVNTTAAAAGAQQISPAIRWSGFGWKTDATAASQAVDFRSYVVPVESAANPTGYLTFESSINGGAYANKFTIDSAGFVGINMTNPSVALDVTGDIEYTGTITDVSDERLKENITDFDSGLSIISSIGVKSYNIISDPGNTEVGFIAQNVQQFFPGAVSIVDPANGYLGVSYVSFVPVLTKAVQELNLNLEAIAAIGTISTPQSESFTTAFFDNVFSRMKTWLADAGNGITDIFADTFHAKDRICINETCINEAQLQAIIGGSPSSSSGSSSGSNPGQINEDNTPPDITLVGEATINLNIGDTYEDPGVIVTDNVSQGLTASTSGEVNTAVSGMYIITYSATDEAGNIGEAVRTVNVVESSNDQGLMTNDQQENTEQAPVTNDQPSEENVQDPVTNDQESPAPEATPEPEPTPEENP